MPQAAKLGAKATKAVAAQEMVRRAEKLIAGLDDVRVADRVAQDPLPATGPVRAHPAHRGRPVEVLRLAGDLHRGRSGHRPGQPGGGARFERRRQDDAAQAARRVEKPDTGEVGPGTGCGSGYYAQEHETIDPERTRLGEHPQRRAGQPASRSCGTCSVRSCSRGEQLEQPAGTLSGGEKTRLALAGLVSSAANVLLLDEPTNNLDPASREQVLDALRRYAGAVVLVTHDPGAVKALHPERVILLPDGTEDHWSADYLDLVELA